MMHAGHGVGANVRVAEWRTFGIVAGDLGPFYNVLPGRFTDLEEIRLAARQRTIGIAVSIAAILATSAFAAETPMLVLDPRLAGPDEVEVRSAVSAGPVVGMAVAAAPSDQECQGWTVLQHSPSSGSMAPLPGAGGRFAVDAALRAAAETLDFRERPARVVLVAAGSSQCISVACSLSRTLAGNGLDFRVDVVGLNADAERLRCIADNTGGTYRTANRTDLQQALTDLLGSAADQRQEGEATVETAKAGDAPALEPALGENIELQTVSADLRAMAGIPIPPPAPRREQPDQPPAAKMETQSESDASGQADLKSLTWAAGRALPAIVALEPASAGQSPAWGVRLQAVTAKDAAPLTSELTFEILAVEGDGAYRLVGRSWAPKPVFKLPAGDYVARVTHGGVVREHRFQASGTGVEAIEQQTIPLNLGYVALSAAATADAPPLESDLRYTLRRTDGGSPIVRYDSQPVLTLPAGEYEVSVESGSARAVSTLDVAAGETVSKTFDLRLGYLRLRPGSGIAAPIAVSIEAHEYDASNSNRNGAPLAEAESRNGEAVLLRLPAGRHMAVAEREGRVVRQMVNVAPGRLTQVTLGAQTAQRNWEFRQF